MALANAMSVSLVSSNVCFGGKQEVYSHESREVKCKMSFSVYIPPKATDGTKVPVLYWLSGLTCTEQNFIIKSGFQRYASEEGVVVVGPDTSPRGLHIDGEEDDYDFGTGAGFYVDATQDKWKNNYRMFSYVTQELIPIIEQNFPVISGCQSICGHSMGGHGAIVCALKNPGLYKSVSAFSPIANPSKGKWGQKAFTGYLGNDPKDWEEWDSTYLVQKYNGPPLNLLIDQGSDDTYLAEDLMGKNLVDSCALANVPVIYRLQEGYDHSFFFVSTFIGEHIRHHSKAFDENVVTEQPITATTVGTTEFSLFGPSSADGASLDILKNYEALIVKQEVDIMGQMCDKYLNGKTILTATEEEESCCSCNCCRRGRRFEMKLTDEKGREVLRLKMKNHCCGQCFCFCRYEKLQVFSPTDSKIGSIEESCNCFHKQLMVYSLSNSDPIYSVNGPNCQSCRCCCTGTTFSINNYSTDEKCGTIAKKWSGLAKEALTYADNFCDLMYFEKSPKKDDDDD
ncbi:unnamed protein product [Medioppia subpectinata]|uniref:S-formylglutathione hydrolase n=1 Tax=Medioppia subpectinata TaxID=1979941 RepID=A0A7R9KG60_9ACAR|nr:unnamed protein product [Medioppia subpectinata]CAG2102752.1 unnamed protein product [Medioppia subpectinata]